MPTRKSVRVVFYASPDLVMRYVSLAETYDLPRSEAYRLALERAYKPMMSWLQRTRPDVAVGAPGSRSGSGTHRDSVVRDKVEHSPLAALARYAAQLASREPDDGDRADRDQLRKMLLVQADILGMNPNDATAFVDVLVEDVLSGRAVSSRPSSGDGDASPSPSASASPGGESTQQPLPVADPVRIDLD